MPLTQTTTSSNARLGLLRLSLVLTPNHSDVPSNALPAMQRAARLCTPREGPPSHCAEYQVPATDQVRSLATGGDNKRMSRLSNPDSWGCQSSIYLSFFLPPSNRMALAFSQAT